MNKLFDVTAKRADLTPHDVAMEELNSGRSVTYAQLEERTSRLASHLRAEGVSAQDRVAILCRNRIEFFEALFACAKLGAILVPLNWRMPAAELKPLVDDSTPSLMIYGAEDAAVARALMAHCPMQQLALDDPEGGYEARLAAAAPDRFRDWWPAEDCWYLLYTSGTTGQPKAVIQTYQMALVNMINLSQAIDLRREDVTVNYLPLFHTAGINLHTLPVLMTGGKVLVLPGFDAEPIMDLLTSGAIDIFFAVPAVYQALSLHPDFAKADLSRIRSWGCGGAPLPESLIHTYAAQGADVCNGMGMTETGPTVFLLPRRDSKRKIASVGKAQWLAEARVVDMRGHDTPVGTAGELWIRGPGITPGYWNKPDATDKAFTPDGWLRTGDIAQIDDEGYFYIVGRLKDMFISGGENVYPVEIENCLAAHPAVLEAAVLAEPDERWGEVGHAYIELRPGQAAPCEADLIAYCRDHLAAYKVPKHFFFVDAFPRTAAGKVQKHLITRQRDLAGVS